MRTAVQGGGQQRAAGDVVETLCDAARTMTEALKRRERIAAELREWTDRVSANLKTIRARQRPLQRPAVADEDALVPLPSSQSLGATPEAASLPGVLKKRILIIDDHPAAREGLAARIAREADLDALGVSLGSRQALQLIRTERLDVAVLGLCASAGDGIALIKRIKALNDLVRILVWSPHLECLHAERAFRAGAAGYISKEEGTDQVHAAIRGVLDRGVYLTDEAAARLLRSAFAGPKRFPQSSMESLSDRELEVFRLIGEGRSASDIASRLHLSVHTIETHRYRIKRKLDLKSGLELTRAAMKWVLETASQ